MAARLRQTYKCVIRTRCLQSKAPPGRAAQVRASRAGVGQARIGRIHGYFQPGTAGHHAIRLSTGNRVGLPARAPRDHGQVCFSANASGDESRTADCFSYHRSLKRGSSCGWPELVWSSPAGEGASLGTWGGWAASAARMRLERGITAGVPVPRSPARCEVSLTALGTAPDVLLQSLCFITLFCVLLFGPVSRGSLLSLH